MYVGGGVLVSDLDPDTSRAAGVSVDESTSGGGSVLVGFDLSSRFALEGHYADLGEADLSPAGSIGYQVGGLSALVYGLNSESNRLNRTGFSGYGRLGVGILENDSDDVDFNQVNDVHLLAGIGVEYGLGNGLAGRAEIVANESDARYAQLALLYRFGAASRGSNSRSSSTQERSVEDDALTQPPLVEAAPAPEPAVAQPIAPPAEPELPVASESSDTDEDGVSDDTDACLDTRQGMPVDETGCELLSGAVEGVNFLSGSDELTEGANTVLAEVVNTLNEYPDVKVLIKAHTDNSGDAEDNLQLSRRRALAVARYLVEQGISGSRLKAQAFGESEPRVSNQTPEGRAANRRVEFETFE